MRQVLVISENMLFREGLQHLLAAEPGVQLAGVVGSLAEAMRLGEEVHPDVLLVAVAENKLDEREALDYLLGLDAEQVAVVTLDDSSITIYSRHEHHEASVRALLDLLAGIS